MRALLDPRLRPQLQDYYPSICTIQSQTEDDSGSQPVFSDPTDIAGMVNLACRIGPLILIRPTDNENRTEKVTENYVSRQLKINGYFPQIQVRFHKAVVDGVTYPIRGVEHDGNRLTTRLRLEVVEPNG